MNFAERAHFVFITMGSYKAKISPGSLTPLWNFRYNEPYKTRY